MGWKLIVAFLMVTTISGVLLYHQKEYEIVLERMVIKGTNKDYMKFYKIENIKYNRTTRVANMTSVFARDIIRDFKVSIQAYKFTSNEYRTFPINLNFNMCDALETDMYGLGNFLACGNYTKCNFKKDVPYVICNWMPNYEKFPPLIPQGDYKLNLRFTTNATYVTDLDAYGKVIYKKK